MTDIFISYASKDRERLRPLRDALEARGWSVFWDQEIPVGKNWRRNIFEHLRAARCVIVAWSSASIESDWVSEEAADALKREVLLPIYIDQVEPSFGFADIQTMNFVGWSGEETSESFRRLVSEVTRILGAPPQPQPQPAVARSDPAKALTRIVPAGRKIVLIGFSGGGALAMLLAQRLPAVVAVVTLAANLDINAWADLHGYTRLRASLNPVESPPLPEEVVQLHYAGAGDSRIPPELLRDALNRIGGKLILLPHTSHTRGWERHWPMILKELDSRLTR